MALYFYTNQPKTLLASFKKLIDQGHIETWKYDADNDFTHDTPQWKNQAWMRPEVNADSLAFYIVKPVNIKISKTVYGIYHGRLIESMLTHCDDLFSNAVATATVVPGKDIV